MRNLETDMEDAGQDPAVGWPVGVLEWVWSHPGAYKEVQRCARICVRDERLHGML
jgi:hypothetical protein